MPDGRWVTVHGHHVFIPARGGSVGAVRIADKVATIREHAKATIRAKSADRTAVLVGLVRSEAKRKASAAHQGMERIANRVAAIRARTKPDTHARALESARQKSHPMSADQQIEIARRVMLERIRTRRNS